MTLELSRLKPNDYEILDSGDFNSSPVTRWFDNYILDSVFRIKEVNKSRFL